MLQELSWLDAYALDQRRLQYAQARMQIAATLDPERQYAVVLKGSNRDEHFTGLELQHLCAQTVRRLTTRDYPEDILREWSEPLDQPRRRYWSDRLGWCTVPDSEEYEPPAYEWADDEQPF